MKKTKKTLYAIIYVSIILILISLGLILRSVYINSEQVRFEEEARLTAEEAMRTEAATPTPRPSAATECTEATPEAEKTAEPEPTPEVIRDSFTAMREKFDNEDIVGHLKIEGTSIDYPVVQYSDNDYYLNRDIYKSKNVTGWIFMDYENNIKRQDKNTIIYGHNMKQDIMFHSLRYYVDEEFFREHRYITLSTLYEDTTWEVFSFMKTHISFNYLQVFFPNEDQFVKLIDGILERRMYDTQVTVTPEDRILNLSTCPNSLTEPDYRFVVSAKLVTE